mmetsp:Transcript_159449/g.290871  ORF Transcript_159449/g.290871 Transcript_159449/m.290871 type:complete len:93 (+) Transcript_159449:313-591(+)
MYFMTSPSFTELFLMEFLITRRMRVVRRCFTDVELCRDASVCALASLSLHALAAGPGSAVAQGGSGAVSSRCASNDDNDNDDDDDGNVHVEI